MANPRAKRQRKRRGATLSPAERWWLTGQLDKKANPFAMFALDSPVRTFGAPSNRDRRKMLLSRYADLIPDGRHPLLEASMAGGGGSVIDHDILAYWAAHGVTQDDPCFDAKDHPVERWSDPVAEVDGAPIQRHPIPSRWLNQWRRLDDD